LSFENLRDKSPKAAQETLADAFHRLDSAERADAAAKDLLGRSGLQLLPALEQGSSAIERWAQVAQNVGIALKKDVVAAMERAARRELALPLSPAEPEDVVKAIAFGLRFENGRRIWQADEYMAVITAKRMLEHLTLDGFVVLKQPPLGGHSTLGRGFVG
jgi:hypothetical protein